MRFTLLVVLTAALTGCGDIKASLDAGYEFGRHNDIRACLAKSLELLESCDSLECQAFAMGHSRGCAKTSSDHPEFCKSLPQGIVAAAAWMEDECASSVNPKACYKVMQQPVARCLNDAA